MTRTPEPLELSEAEAIDVAYTLRDLKPEDIDSDWIDDMVHRLFRQLERQLEHIEKFSNDDKASARSTKNARTLETLQRTMSQLTRMEAERVKYRKNNPKMTKEEALASMQRKLDLLIERQGAIAVLAKPLKG
jgi:hypothetical protein